MVRKTQILLCLISALCGCCITMWAQHQAVHSSPASIPAPQPQGSASEAPPVVAVTTPAVEPTLSDDALSPEERISVAVYDKVNRSVVNINTKSVRNDAFFMFEMPSAGAGSGSVLNAKGHVLTNYHVVQGAREIQVTLFDGKSYEARLVGKDESNDVAVLKIDAPAGSLLPVVLGDSSRLKVGQRVFAIGNPFGLERTLTTGIISSLNRSLPTSNNRTIKSIIQLDAAINPGNSGGPLLDSHGRLIGMNTAIYSNTGQSSGVGFAIPAANIARIVPQLIEHGHVIRPDAGITRVLQTEKGLLIATMLPGGAAEQAGLRGFRIIRQRRGEGPFSYQTTTIDRDAADLITAVDGEKITTADDFLAQVEAKRPGDKVVLTIMREGHMLDVPLQLSSGED